MKKSVLLLIIIAFLFSANAEIKLPAIFCDNMVLQQNAKVSIWGWSNPGDTVVVMGSWDNIPVKAAANTQNKWIAQLQTPAAKTDGSSYTVTVSGRSKISMMLCFVCTN